MARYFVQDTSLTAIADAIRAKTGGTDALTLDGMAEAISGIEAGAKLDTCTLTVDMSVDYVYLDVVDGKIVQKQKSTSTNTTSCLCWSIIVVRANSGGHETASNVTLLGNVSDSGRGIYAYFVTAGPGETARITFSGGGTND